MACSLLGCLRLVKRSQVLRGRNLTRDNQAEDSPRVHRASGVKPMLEAPFLPPAKNPSPLGHPRYALENPAAQPHMPVGSTGWFTGRAWWFLRCLMVLALKFVGGIVLPSGVARAS